MMLLTTICMLMKIYCDFIPLDQTQNTNYPILNAKPLKRERPQERFMNLKFDNTSMIYVITGARGQSYMCAYHYIIS